MTSPYISSLLVSFKLQRHHRISKSDQIIKIIYNTNLKYILKTYKRLQICEWLENYLFSGVAYLEL